MHGVTAPEQRLSSDNLVEVQEIGKWYFLCQLPARNLESFGSVHEHWVKEIWDLGRFSRAMCAVVGAMALQKKAMVVAPQTESRYYEQKCRVVQSIAA